jgi:hypothetical protein
MPRLTNIYRKLVAYSAVWWGILAVSCTTSEQLPITPMSRQAAIRPIIRDSAGVRIVEYPNLGPASASFVNRRPNPTALQLEQLSPALRLADKPFLEIGGLESEQAHEFDSRNPLLTTVTLSSGVIVANDLRRLMYFSPDGRLLRVAGREGRGPGEFMQTRDLCLIKGDRVAVTDYASQRVAVFDSVGRLLQAAPRPGDMPGGACTTDGNFVVRDPGGGAPSDTGDRLAPHRVVTLDGRTVASIGRLPVKAPGIYSPVPYVVLHDDEIIVGSGRTFEIKVYDRGGRLKRVTRLLRHLSPITDAEWKARLSQSTPRGTEAAVARFWRNVEASRPYRDPAFSQIRVDLLKRIWVSDYQSHQRWTLFDQTGVLIGRFALDGDPVSRRELAGFGPGYIVVRYRDGDGALRLSFYRELASD